MMTMQSEELVEGIKLDEIGHTIHLKGVVIGGLDKEATLLFPEEEGGLSLEKWEKWLKQSDNPIFYVTDFGRTVVKAIIRKSTRQVEETIKWKVYRRDNFTCQYCGATDLPLTVDHYVAQDFGGATTVQNLKAACRPCNKKKANKTIAEWDAYRKLNNLRGPGE